MSECQHNNTGGCQLCVDELTDEVERLLGHFHQLEHQMERFRDLTIPECDAAWFLSRTSYHIRKALYTANHD
jgi:hypothetical protein